MKVSLSLHRHLIEHIYESIHRVLSWNCNWQRQLPVILFTSTPVRHWNNYSKIEMIAPAFQTGNGLERVLVFRIWAGFQHAYAKMLSKKRPRQSTAIWRLTLTRRSEGVTVVEHHQFSLLVDKVHQIWCQDIHLSRWTMWTRMALIGKWQIFSDQSVPWMSALPVFLLLALHESLESVFFLRKWQTTNNIIPCKREVTGGTSNKESRKLAVE